MSTGPKVATIRETTSLGSMAIYAITYTVGGITTGHSLARGDELDAWRTDLTAAGWTLEETAVTSWLPPRCFMATELRRASSVGGAPVAFTSLSAGRSRSAGMTR